MKSMLKIYILVLFLVNSGTAQVTGLSGWNIFVDPGHSQRENMGAYGYSEAERNVRAALALRNVLMETTDIDTVFLSRTNDQQQVSLSQRSSLANSLGTAWFHSIHSNAPSTTKNSTLLLWGQYYTNEEKVPNGGKAMSDIMVDILTRGMRTDTDGSWGDCSFYSRFTTPCSPSFPGPWLHVNRQTTMPSELSEAGFHTNPVQNQLFMSDRWRKLEAMTYYWTILKYHEIERPFVGIVTGIIRDLESQQPVNGAIVNIGGQLDTTDTYESLFYKYSNDPDLLRNGFYYIDNLPNEDLQIIVGADGYYGDTLQVNPSDTFFTFKDINLINKVPPYMVESTPANGDTNVPAWNDILLKFSRKMDRASVEANLVIEPDVERGYLWSGGETRLLIRSDTLQYQTNYTITIDSSATDKYGHPFDGNADGVGGDDFVLTFKTGTEDRDAPVVENFYPQQDAERVYPYDIINLTFDERINFATVSEDILKLKRLATGTFVSGVFDHYEINNQSVLNFFPFEQFMPGERYITRLFPGIQDVFGNEMSGYTTFSFETLNNNFEITEIDAFEINVNNNWWNPSGSGSTTGIVPDSTYRAENNNIVNLLSESRTSLELNYGWDTNANSWLIRMYLTDSQPKNVHFTKDYVLQAYVFGDGSGNQFRFCLDDKVPNYLAANHEVSPWFTIDWIGWKLVSWDMSVDGTGSWLGDGNLDGTLRFDSIQLTYVPGSAQFGTIYFDDLHIAEKLPTGVIENTTSTVIDGFELKQNYPNPFNNSTTIPYTIHNKVKNVRLLIFNSLGQKVTTFENLNTNPGNYQVNWSVNDDYNKNLTSGFYYYELQVDGRAITKQMIYLK